MVGPLPANPFEREVVVESAGGYRFGVVGVAPPPRVEWVAGDDGYRVTRLDDPTARAALSDPSIRGFLGWARFPFVEVEELRDGRTRVWVIDARYLRTLPRRGPSFGAALSQVVPQR
jgi:inner membrane protein